MFFFLFFSNPHSFCKVSKYKDVKRIYTGGGKIKLKEMPEREKIRFFLDLRQIENPSIDPYSCITVGQTVIVENETYTCTKNDILTEDQIQSFVETTKNLKKFIEGMLKVEPLTTDIQMTGIEGFVDMPNCSSEDPDCNNVTDHDLAITFVSHPSSYIGQTVQTSIVEPSKRTIHSIINIRPNKVPSSPQSNETFTNTFYYILLHEMIHALGVSHDNYENFHPRGLYRAYPTYNCTLTKNGKQRVFLTTPYSHIYAVKHFGVEYFYGDDGTRCPSGIELEDYDDNYNHLKSRMFFTEVFSSLTYTTTGPFIRFTDASLALLLDTGNYDVDWSYASPILWLNSDSIDGSNFSDKALSSYLDYPSEYYATYVGVPTHTMGFDYKYEAKSYYRTSISCEDYDPSDESTYDYETNYYCSNPGYYDPDNDGYTGLNPQQDYTPTKYPRKICPEGYATFPGNSGCLRYELKKSSILIKIDDDIGNPDGVTYKCTSKNEGEKMSYRVQIESSGKFEIRKYVFYCPNNERFRRSIQMYYSKFTSDPFASGSFNYSKELVEEDLTANDSDDDSSSKTYPDPTEYGNKGNNNEQNRDEDGYLGLGVSAASFYLIIGGLVILLVLILGIIYVVKKCVIPIVGGDDDKDEEVSESDHDDNDNNNNKCTRHKKSKSIEDDTKSSSKKRKRVRRRRSKKKESEE